MLGSIFLFLGYCLSILFSSKIMVGVFVPNSSANYWRVFIWL